MQNSIEPERESTLGDIGHIEELPSIYALTNAMNLESSFQNGSVIASFQSKEDLKRYVKHELPKIEKASIVISSSKNYAIYFCCEKSGHYRTTVKDNRKRNAFTKREKCDYKLVANYQDSKWVLKMVSRVHNHTEVFDKRKIRKLVTYAAIAEDASEEQIRQQIMNHPSNNPLPVQPKPPRRSRPAPRQRQQQNKSQNQTKHRDPAPNRSPVIATPVLLPPPRPSEAIFYSNTSTSNENADQFLTNNVFNNNFQTVDQITDSYNIQDNN